ncbi:Hypothetical secreted protein [Clostridium acetobutylicum EA 2018]|uniref:Hypothetical secreted protein n=1 Tax=Clostridium acetobutylicum (strain ATCC 824 / DSM 792 / JCM 1419 / IAM 19013 / LMG 5710 / NBRC 13948 / NRRL B-527 / VKM B-1787 / 2291 / W) TaxID=272562 RepID=Q97K28_CLOAB|nr:DUF4883 family protein [Clostridium acetobutylicum]ADZ20142.1 Hypothetical secreted protein [Clostridium acetobutylicum EA 2018]PSM04963.1 hypothetical protein C7T89_16590 [Clostridium sp. NJ4]AAK79067.1 Hypothetical secreted protein [Clostridium acetobutylicum ATCC 824]AEI31612.1 hypothetical protein SMB_G1111 [Clostridium acetobutylicum DSM 1731]AWV81678.1 hypothetical protein DK921_16595 [Clostridium acetobutylicum]
MNLSKLVIIIKAKKITFLILLVIFCTSFSGCNELIDKKKPFNFYYTNLLAKSFVKEKALKFSLIDTSYYKNHNLTATEIDTIRDFLVHLKKHNYINKPSKLPAKPMYRLFLTFSNSKFVIDVYDENYAAVYPWDGYYPKDFLNIKDIPPSCNPYNFCTYIIPR